MHENCGSFPRFSFHVKQYRRFFNTQNGRKKNYFDSKYLSLSNVTYKPEGEIPTSKSFPSTSISCFLMIVNFVVPP